MKKFKSIVLAITLVLSTCLIGCGKEPVKVDLTGENIEDYFIFDVSLEDVDISPTMGLFSAEYTTSANMNVSAKLKKDVAVEDVVIEGYITTSGLCWAGRNWAFKLQVDKDGEATTVERLEPLKNQVGGSSIMKPDYPEIFTVHPDLEEGEYLVDDDNIVITSVTGCVYEEQE